MRSRIAADLRAMFRAERLFSGLRPPTPPAWLDDHAAPAPPPGHVRSALAARDHPTSIDDLDAPSSDLAELRTAGVHLLVPLAAAGDLVGVLNVGPRGDGTGFTEDDRSVLARIGRTAARGLRLARLAEAIDNDEFELHYQPKVDLVSGAVTGVEALARWRHPQRGLLPPARFIPLVEDGPLIADFTRWVVTRAIDQLAAWCREGWGENLTMAVNVPPRLFVSPAFVDDLAAVLADAPVDAERVELELTETAFVGDQEAVRGAAERLTGLGVQLAIDDFGTGYSSLSSLRHLPVRDVKIDRSFVTDMVANDGDQVIVRSTISLSHDLGFRVVAEGVEDDVTATMLAELGCDRAQGYLWTRPLPADEFAAWLSEHGQSNRDMSGSA